jgi:hypothetical protein
MIHTRELTKAIKAAFSTWKIIPEQRSHFLGIAEKSQRQHFHQEHPFCVDSPFKYIYFVFIPGWGYVTAAVAVSIMEITLGFF